MATVPNHTHDDLDKQLSAMKNEIAALTRKCAALEQKLAGASNSPTGDYVTKREWGQFRRVIAKKIGLRI